MSWENLAVGQDAWTCCCEHFGWRPGWQERLPWVHKPLGGWLTHFRLRGGFCIISINIHVRNVMSMTHDWNRILFLSCSTGCIKEIWILWKKKKINFYLLLLFFHLLIDCLKRWYGVCARKRVCYLLDKANQMINIDIGKWYKS